MIGYLHTWLTGLQEQLQSSQRRFCIIF